MKLRYTSSADLHTQWQFRNKKRADYLGDYTWAVGSFFYAKNKVESIRK